MPRPRSQVTAGSRVAIIGAGFGGIATAVNLRRAGICDFVVFERAEAAGGTWHLNRYPGCEVDINTGVADASWNDVDQNYLVTLKNGEQHHFDVVVASVGLFNAPKYQDWPGLGEFQGVIQHSARWDPGHDLRGKIVGLVGTGSSSVQITPELAETVEHLYVFQREAGWVLPKDCGPYREQVRARWRRRPLLQKLARFKQWAIYEMMLKNAWTSGSRQNAKLEKICRRYIADEIADPELRRMVTPTHPFACKRPLFTDTFYAALQRDNVTLVPHPVTALTTDSVVSADGVTRKIDALVMATGFQTQRFLAGLDVHDARGRELDEVWNGTPEAFLGLTVPGFPNFFMVYGPNTNGGSSIILMLERQAEAIARSLVRLRSSGAAVIDTRPLAHRLYTRWLNKENDRRWTAARYCNNYYFSATGQNVTQYPRSSLHYRLMVRILFGPGTSVRGRRAFVDGRLGE